MLIILSTSLGDNVYDIKITKLSHSRDIVEMRYLEILVLGINVTMVSKK